MMEILLGLTFLSIVAVAVLQTRRMATKFERRSMERLAVELSLENATEKLAAVPYSEMEETLAQWSIDDPAMEIQYEPFQSGEVSGVHIVLKSPIGGGLVQRHAWRWEASDER